MIVTHVQPLRPPCQLPESSLSLPGPLPGAGHCRQRTEGATTLSGCGDLSALAAPSRDGMAGMLPLPDHVM